MAECKIVINDPKSGKSYNKTADLNLFSNKKIEDIIKGDVFGMNGYELQITGGSDRSGFPMRKDLQMGGREKILIAKGVGFKSRRKGIRKRKSVVGSLVNQNTAQLNLKVVKEGTKGLEEYFQKNE